jgi:outer membrane biosynthesis protein TonB
MSSEPHVDPVTIAGDPPTPKVESVPAPAPPEVKRERNVRDDARARIQTPAPTEEKAAHPTVQEMPKSLPPAEKQKPADVATPTQSSPSAGPVAQTATESPEPFIPVQQEPRVVKLADPELGDVAMKYGSTGEVVARVLIGTDGKAMKVRIVKSTNKFLNKPVAEALLRSSFEPGVMTAGPVQSWLTVPFKFR